MDYNLILFDMDGTLVDSSSLTSPGIQTLLQVVRNRGLAIPEDIETRIRNNFPMSFSEGGQTMTKVFDVGEDIGQKIIDDWDAADRKTPPPIIEGFYKLMLSLRQYYRDKAILWGIITRRESESLEIILKNHGIYEHFVFHDSNFEENALLFSSDWGSVSKPNPELFTKIFEYIDDCFDDFFSPDCLYVGDTIEDATFAITAGVDFVAVTSGLDKKERFLEIGIKPENILSSISDLPAFLGLPSSRLKEYGINVDELMRWAKSIDI